jgi:hypothetical protein
MVLQNITKWSGHVLEPTHTYPKTGKNTSLKIFFRIKTDRVKINMVL